MHFGSQKLLLAAKPLSPLEPVYFNYTGAVQIYVVPIGCHRIHVEAVGARGGGLDGSANYAGLGGKVECDVDVAPSQKLYIYVGGKGGDLAGWNGGGQRNTVSGNRYPDSGGGATDIRLSRATEDTDWYDVDHESWDTDNLLLSRIVVAGGGAGYSQNARGANGGGLIGEVVNGGDDTPCTPATQETGGSGAISGTYTASSGVFGKGGDGIVTEYDGTSGAGGGGGWYGGGGGAVYQPGGGGSSYTDATRCTNVVHIQGYSEANKDGWLVITPMIEEPQIGDIVFENRSGEYDFNLPFSGKFGVTAITSGPNSNASMPENLQITWTYYASISGCMHTFDTTLEPGNYHVSIPKRLGQVSYWEPKRTGDYQGGTQWVSLWDAPVILTKNAEQIYKLNNDGTTSNFTLQMTCTRGKENIGGGYIMSGKVLTNAPRCIQGPSTSNYGPVETTLTMTGSSKTYNSTSSWNGKRVVAAKSPLTNDNVGPGAGAEGCHRENGRVVHRANQYCQDGYFRLIYKGK